jgi:hypothetical protein
MAKPPDGFEHLAHHPVVVHHRLLTVDGKPWADVGLHHGYLKVGFVDPQGIVEVQIAPRHSVSCAEVWWFEIRPATEPRHGVYQAVHHELDGKPCRAGRLDVRTRTQEKSRIDELLPTHKAERVVALASEKGVAIGTLRIHPGAGGVTVQDAAGLLRIVIVPGAGAAREGTRVDHALRSHEGEDFLRVQLLDAGAPPGKTEEYLMV